MERQVFEQILTEISPIEGKLPEGNLLRDVEFLMREENLSYSEALEALGFFYSKEEFIEAQESSTSSYEVLSAVYDHYGGLVREVLVENRALSF